MKVRVRMYRQGLGDCFLVTFDFEGEEKHMLIDCGSLGATTTGVKLSDVLEDIGKTTGKHIHLLLATHEHWDHVRGFGELKEKFEGITFDHIWMAWTENPKDAMAQQIAKNKKDLGSALAAASEALQHSPAADESQSMGLAVRDLLGFFGEESLAAGKFSQQVNDAMDVVRLGLNVKAEFQVPGPPVLEPSWMPGFRFYVLGPPKNRDALNDTGEHGSSQLYGMARALEAAAVFRSSNKPISDYLTDPDISENGAACESQMPFDSRFRYALPELQAPKTFYAPYYATSNAWRRIDDDWLHAASDLALQLDSATNNTSLAFAIERISDGKVLLFPADAQEGNWLSWHDDKMKWASTNADGKAVEVTASDLLNRTVFYKVGHHSSHNATAKAKGLELMQQEEELTAFIPVDRAVALKRNPPGSWKMPAAVLYRRLLEKCQGRVVRSDLGWADDARNAKNKDAEKEFLNMATDAEWAKWKKSQTAAANVNVDDIYVDYILS